MLSLLLCMQNKIIMKMDKKILTLGLSIIFSVSFAQQEVQQVEVIKSDKQVTELFDELGDKEIKLEPANN